MGICREMKDDKKKGIGKKNHIVYVLGSIALFAVGCVVIPVIMSKITGMIYTTMSVRKDEEDDWGPVIEKK